MADSSLTLRNTIIGTVIGGLILSIILWLIGFLPTVWRWFIHSLITIWDWVTIDLTIPTWLLSILIILALPTLWRIWLRIVSYTIPIEESEITSAPADEKPLPISISAQLSQNELSALRVLADVDGRYLYLPKVADGIKQNQLRTQQALDSLISKGFVYDSLNYVHGTSYGLSEKGRDLVIELGYA